jgi:hypothetical protein
MTERVALARAYLGKMKRGVTPEKGLTAAMRDLITDRGVTVTVSIRTRAISWLPERPTSHWIALIVRLDQVRRIEFDLDADRVATLVIVPDQPSDEPQLLAIPADQVAAAAAVLVFVAGRLGRRTHA